MNLTPSQHTAAMSAARNNLVIAGPGSGKTKTLIARINELISMGHKPWEMVAITFTNAAAREIARRLDETNAFPTAPLGYCGTLHGYALRQLSQFGSVLGYGSKISIISEEDSTALLHDTAKELGCKIGPRLVEAMRATPKAKPSGAEQIAVAKWRQKMRASSVVDFDTILSDFLALLKLKPEAVKIGDLIVDEFQDSGAVDFEIYRLLQAESRFYVGDPDQCQPAGTMIRMSDGTQKPIQQLIPGDLVVSYARHEKTLLKEATVDAVARRPYSGLLYTVCADGVSSSCTGNHKWLVKWLSGAQRTRSTWCVYLMRKGDNFRIGKTCMFRSGSGKGDVLGLALRIRQEGADAGWILSTHEKEGDAVAREDIVAAIYGLPQTCFKAGYNSLAYTQEVIDSIFAAIPGQISKALRCLKDHGRELAFPLFHKDQPRTRRTVQEIQACNLIDDVMQIPTCLGAYNSATRAGNWVPVKVTTREFSGDVFSLDIRKHHKYVADGLVTCNSIYSFRGGKLENILKISRDEMFEVHTLELNFRSRPQICAIAQCLIEHNSNRIDKATVSQVAGQGVIIYGVGETDQEEALMVAKRVKGWIARGVDPMEIAVLSRSNAQAHLLGDTLKTYGVEIREKRPPNLPHDWQKAKMALDILHDPLNTTMAKRWLRNSLADPQAKEIIRLAALHQTSDLSGFIYGLRKITAAHQIPEALARLGISMESIEWIQAKIDALIEPTIGEVVLAVAMQLGEEVEMGAGVTVTTLHASKGREWECVAIAGLEQEQMPGKRALKETAALEEERRLFYVGLTRAKHELYLSHALQRRETFGRKQYAPATPSQFLKELEPFYV